LRLFSFGDYGLALAALALVVFGAYDSYPIILVIFENLLLHFFVPINHELNQTLSRKFGV